jgi:Uma2 family endonuclease
MAITTPPPATGAAPWGEYIVGLGPMTVEIFDRLTIEAGWVFELHEGRIIRMPGPGNEHGDIQTNLYRIVDVYLARHNLGKLTGTSCYNLPLPSNTEELLCPDLSYVVPARKAQMSQRGSYLVGSPDLVIEIASPSDSRPQMQAKAQVYLAAGVRLFWIIWPSTQSVDVWRPTSPAAPVKLLGLNDQLDGMDVIAGFTCLVKDIFAI